MSGLISIEDIGQCRSGPDNDIDLEAVFGGRISSKKQTGLKVNPLFSESSQSISDAKEETPDINGNMNNVHVITYESIPTKNRNMKFSLKEPTVENGLVIQNKDIITQIDNNSDIDSTVPSMGSIDSLNESFSSPYKLLSQGRNGLPSNEIRNSQSEADIVLDKNKRNSKTFANNYGLLHGVLDTVTQSDTNKPPDNQQNGYHEDVNVIKNDNYQLLRYSKDGYILNENNEETHVKTINNDNKTTEIVEKHDNKPVEHDRKDITELNEDVGSDVKRDTEDIESSSVITEAHVHTIQCEKSVESGAVSDKDNETDRSLVDSSTNSVLSDEEHEVIERTIEISEEWPELNELTKTDIDESVPDDEPNTDIVTLSGSSVLCTDEPDSVTITVSDKSTADNDQTHITALEIEVVQAVHHASNDRSEKSVAGNNLEHNDSVVVEINETVIVHKVEAAVIDTVGDDALSDKNSKTNESHHENETVYTEIHGADSNPESSSTRTLKSILTNNGFEPQSMTSTIKSEHQRTTGSEDEIQECKSVKFSEDTVFNENKSKKYRIEKVERIHLRDIYRGKISSNAAAKLNPLYKDDGELEDKDVNSMTEEERAAYLEAVKKMTDTSKDKQGNLNTPTYLEHYLILKAHGLKPENFDIEQLPREMERPAYEKLIERTLAKERRKLIIKWTLVILTVGIITAVATTLGVMLKDR